MSRARADRPLREGFTTGSAAAAAAYAATLALCGNHVPATVEVCPPPQSTLPAGTTIPVPVFSSSREGGVARATVIKDGGDDPDATHGAAIVAEVQRVPTNGIEVLGGTGVGVVTCEGLPVPVGSAAINPGPLAQIAAMVRRADPTPAHGYRVTISVPDGEAIARKTLNARLGIVGGISILGTRGTVKPYSHASWQATVEQSLDVAHAQGARRAAFSTGGRTERLLAAHLQDHGVEVLPAAQVQAADFFGVAMAGAAARGFAHVHWGVYPGKLAKQACGTPYTHARSIPVDFASLAVQAAALGADPHTCIAVARARTVRHVVDMLRSVGVLGRFVASLVAQARSHAVRLAAQQAACGSLAVTYTVFDFDDTLLYTDPL